MIFQILSVVIAVFAVIALLATLRWLLQGSWFIGWLKGMAGAAAVAIVAFSGLSAWDVFSYEELNESQVLATLAFSKEGNQQFDVTVTLSNGQEAFYELTGDQWQMDARMLFWKKGLQKMGVKPGYRLDRLSGRYLSLEQERHSPRSVYNLGPEATPVDIWQLLNRYASDNSILIAKYGSATFMPMVDNGIFEVRLSATGLVGRPVNEPARSAVEQWDVAD